MKKRNSSRFVSLALLALIVIGLLSLTGCTTGTSKAMVWVDAETHEVIELGEGQTVQTEKDASGSDLTDERTGEEYTLLHFALQAPEKC